MKKDRKIRSDKKREIRPTLSSYVKEDIYTYSYLTEQPVKDVCVFLLSEGLQNDKILGGFQSIMLHDFQVGNTVYIGNRKGGFPVRLKWDLETGRITTKLTQDLYEQLNRLSYAIDLSVSSTCALMLKSVLYSYEFMDEHLLLYKRVLDKKRYNELEKFLCKIIIDNEKKTYPFV